VGDVVDRQSVTGGSASMNASVEKMDDPAAEGKTLQDNLWVIDIDL
jgi:hypothetical protein